MVLDNAAYTVCAAFGSLDDDRISLTVEDITVKVEDAEYTGSEVEPKVEVWYKGELLVPNVDYVVSYENNIEVSKGQSEKPKVVITGIGDFKDTISVDFEIIPKDSGNHDDSTSDTYTGDSTNINNYIIVLILSTMSMLFVVFIKDK